MTAPTTTNGHAHGHGYADVGGLLVPTYALTPSTTRRTPVDQPAPVDPTPGPVDVDHQAPVDVDHQAPVDVDHQAPVDVDQAQSTPDHADALAEQLAAERAAVDVRREHELLRREADVDHRDALADVDQTARDRRRQRRDQAREARAQARLDRHHRRAARSGVRARIRADIDRSAEMRALRVARVRTATLAVGLPALTALAAWSTAGVQAGVVRLLGLDHGSPGWVAAWGMEPALMSIVALIIIGRAMLTSSGGRTDWRASAVEWGALATSIALNLAGGTGGDVSGWSAVGAMLAHSVGPVGAAAVAYLIGLLLGYVADARPWDGAPRLADLDIGLTGGRLDVPSHPVSQRKHASESVPDASPDATLTDAERTLLADVRDAITAGALPPDPSGHAIRRTVMGGRGDRTRAQRVARLVAGWRPGGAR